MVVKLHDVKKIVNGFEHHCDNGVRRKVMDVMVMVMVMAPKSMASVRRPPS